MVMHGSLRRHLPFVITLVLLALSTVVCSRRRSKTPRYAR